MARLIITRPRQYVDMLRSYRLILDGVPTFTIRRGQSVSIDLGPGSHRLMAAIDWVCSNSVEIDMSSDEDHRLEVGSNVDCWRFLRTVLYLTVWRDRYLYLKPVSRGDAADPLCAGG